MLEQLIVVGVVFIIGFVFISRGSKREVFKYPVKGYSYRLLDFDPGNCVHYLNIESYSYLKSELSASIVNEEMNNLKKPDSFIKSILRRIELSRNSVCAGVVREMLRQINTLSLEDYLIEKRDNGKLYLEINNPRKMEHNRKVLSMILEEKEIKDV